MGFTFREDTDAAFEQAIAEGRLCERSASRAPYESHAPYADEYMYMGTLDGRDTFKHSTTRLYLRS